MSNNGVMLPFVGVDKKGRSVFSDHFIVLVKTPTGDTLKNMKGTAVLYLPEKDEWCVFFDKAEDRWMKSDDLDFVFH